MPEQMWKQLERWHSPWVAAAAEALAVPRRQRRSQSAGEGKRVGCCF
ncbi:rCG24106 [Rattus norvegicus]|uniref:RCG24106 n=1 Tax=Rattus norvegicus TaxID=10116 RepID=A6KAL5_RAT|nr:rCG24106 [Rattus norvegicus]